ncbi:MAG: SDR family NAD(P)-dependent oxidoreductase [Defluviitaleaceae bacterium]|nr:SDR family NAD(P)-dependent oxidoreductase [Defluviitaleaceae bacterium]
MQSVLITGADRGLGLSLCKEYLNRGWEVFAGKYMEDYDFLENLRHENLHVLRLDMGNAKSIDAAAEKITALDMLISNASLMGKVNCSFEEPMDLEAVWRAYNVNAVGPLTLVQKLVPKMRGMRRICFVSSEVACISLMKNRYNDTFPYPMSKAAMNMAVRILHNDMYEKGYTFRLFHPGWMKFREKDGTLAEEGKYDPDDIGKIAAAYFENPLRDENRLVMVDYDGYEWPW